MKEKKEKTNASIEQIFAHAVALDQSGRLKNTIYISGKKVYILNSDQTVLLKFMIPQRKFNHDLSFKANDYEGDFFYEKDGKIVFESSEKSYSKKKHCVVPGKSPTEVSDLFKSFAPITENKIILSHDILGLIDKALSHIEISSRDGKMLLIQRNIYNGSVSEITKAQKGFGISGDTLEEDWGPIGIRTPDFEALFAFQNSLEFSLDPAAGYIRIKGNKWKMKGIIASCLYDEMGTIKYLKE